LPWDLLMPATGLFRATGLSTEGGLGTGGRDSVACFESFFTIRGYLLAGFLAKDFTGAAPRADALL